ncbi:MAG: TetR/AcrR family transcriptional regulator [Gammaproteobacteria bacterium]|nr:TetR/AcrR family transcriptional regulator [Gammaproteobacteria bacterium]
MSLRARQVDARRHRILDAAALLIRQTGGTDFSMRALAEAADTAPATPYNLFTSKEGLLYALLSRSLDDITLQGLALRARDPLDRALEAALKAADIFLLDPTYMRPLYQFLLGVVDPIHRPRFIERSLAYWRTALASAEAANLFNGGLLRSTLEYALMAQFMGVLDFWIHDDVDAAGFRRRVTSGTVLLLLPLANETQRARLLRRLRSAHKITRQPGLGAVVPIGIHPPPAQESQA